MHFTPSLHLGQQVLLSPPDGATAFGHDRYGIFADFELTAVDKPASKVKQRIRWIPPGRFEMGSPLGDAGRDEDGALHTVTITSGYWMFETLCTQQLWLAVMGGDNPSRFPDPERLIEQVSWEEASTFAKRMSERIVGLNFELPTEAQWEYACRAGARTALYSGQGECTGAGPHRMVWR